MSNRKKAIFLLILTSLCFALMSTFMKLATDIPSLEKAFFRNVISFIIASFLFIKYVKGEVESRAKEENKSKRELIKEIASPKSPKLLFARAVAGTLGVTLNYQAIDYLPLADSSVLQKLSPFYTIIFSYFLLKENITRKQIVCIAFAFIGCVIAVGPQFSSSSGPYMMGILGAGAAGLAYTFIRMLGLRGENGKLIILTFSFLSLVFIFPMMIGNYVPLVGVNLLYVVLGSLCATGAQLSLTKAYSLAPSKEISIYEYTQPLFAAVLGLVFFGTLPTMINIIGFIIIIGSAIMLYVDIPFLKKDKENKVI
ncbi:MAG: DMT family transporter [Lachnospirales bacterium]